MDTVRIAKNFMLLPQIELYANENFNMFRAQLITNGWIPSHFIQNWFNLKLIKVTQFSLKDNN